MTSLEILTVLGALQEEIIDFTRPDQDYDGKDGNEILVLERARNTALAEMVARQGRVMAFMAGEKVEPEVHFGEGVLLGVGGS